jgi:DNA-binding HxlR family transcriptional regulator
MSDRSEQGSYGQFCPIAMASEIICWRWTALVLRELLCGTTRFNDLRRGLPRMSPTLLSKRLKELADAGVITTTPTNQSGVVEYRLTKAGEDQAFGADPRNHRKFKTVCASQILVSEDASVSQSPGTSER